MKAAKLEVTKHKKTVAPKKPVVKLDVKKAPCLKL